MSANNKHPWGQTPPQAGKQPTSQTGRPRVPGGPLGACRHTLPQAPVTRSTAWGPSDHRERPPLTLTLLATRLQIFSSFDHPAITTTTLTQGLDDLTTRTTLEVRVISPPRLL